jgi:murein L,D-transpeptidase YafK
MANHRLWITRWLILCAAVPLLAGCTDAMMAQIFGTPKPVAYPDASTLPVTAGDRNQYHGRESGSYAGAPVDRVVVYKQKRLLELWQRDELVRQYPIALGRQPVGPKQREGDLRTPEGTYLIDWRNAESDYSLSMHISYPNLEDRTRAKKMRTSPGGMIMIHGQPTWLAGFPPVYHDDTWTLGCIAVNNYAMREIWQRVPDGTPIEIHP